MGGRLDENSAREGVGMHNRTQQNSALIAAIWWGRWLIVATTVIFALLGGYRYYLNNVVERTAVLKYSFVLKNIDAHHIRLMLNSNSFLGKVLDRLEFRQELLPLDNAFARDRTIGKLKKALVLEGLHVWQPAYEIGVAWRDAEQGRAMLGTISAQLEEEIESGTLTGSLKPVDATGWRASVRFPALSPSGKKYWIAMERVLEAPYIKERLAQVALSHERKDFRIYVGGAAPSRMSWSPPHGLVLRMSQEDVLGVQMAVQGYEIMLAARAGTEQFAHDLMAELIRAYNEWPARPREEYLDAVRLVYEVNIGVPAAIAWLESPEVIRSLAALARMETSLVFQGVKTGGEGSLTNIVTMDIVTGSKAQNKKLAQAVQAHLKAAAEGMAWRLLREEQDALAARQPAALDPSMIQVVKEEGKSKEMVYEQLDPPHFDRYLGNRYGLVTLVVGFGILGLMLSVVSVLVFRTFQFRTEQ